MPIDGVRTIESEHFSILYIDRFSDDFKQIIREQLRGVWNGFSEADSLPEFYSYKNTLASFLDRYNDKTDETKKGMIAELLAHLLIGQYYRNMTSLSILKNKEERSIKKGFDIIYCKMDLNQLWYAEVKSGRSEDGIYTSSEYNIILLDRAKTSINKMFEAKRNNLWESALLDVSATIKENEGRLNLKQLLSNDAPSKNISQRKNVILVSTLYHNLLDEISENSIDEYKSSTIQEGLFDEVLIISIQKNTFETVVNYLTDELMVA